MLWFTRELKKRSTKYGEREDGVKKGSGSGKGAGRGRRGGGGGEGWNGVRDEREGGVPKERR